MKLQNVEITENTPDPTTGENLTLTEPENLFETPAESPGTQAETRVIKVRIENFTFNPDSVPTSLNDTVRWKNLDLITHTITGPDFSSGTPRDGDFFEFRFTKEGVYEYYCEIHPSMKGVVIVEE